MALTDEQKAFVDWQLAQIDPLTGQRIGDIVAAKGLDPYRDEVAGMADNAAAQAKNQLAAGGDVDVVAPWLNPNWREVQAANEEAEYQRRAQLDADWRAAQAAGVNVPVLGPSNDPNLGNVTRGPAPYNPGSASPPQPGANPLVPGNSGGTVAGNNGSSGGSLVNAGGPPPGATGTGLGTTGVVYGPDGRAFSSAAAALAAGVANYSYTKPMFGPQNQGLITGASDLLPSPNAATGNATPGGLISGANQQLFKMPTGAQMPSPVVNPFKV